MGSWSTRGRNGGAPPEKWYGALRQQQVPLGRWMAYVYDLNQNEMIWYCLCNTAKEAKQALDITARGFNGNRTNLNFSGSAAAPPPVSGAALESWQREGGAGYMPWQSGGRRETQGPEYIFWQGGDHHVEGSSRPQFPEFHYWQDGNGRSR